MKMLTIDDDEACAGPFNSVSSIAHTNNRDHLSLDWTVSIHSFQ